MKPWVIYLLLKESASQAGLELTAPNRKRSCSVCMCVQLKIRARLLSVSGRGKEPGHTSLMPPKYEDEDLS